jgi:isopenicillin-N N-acyltransferase-like protein
MPEANPCFPEIHLHGTAQQRGHAHGEQLRDSIHEVLEYYRSLFQLSDKQLREEAAEYARIIRAFSPEYAQEIEAIAAAAGLHADYIVALNSRSEILNNAGISECTSLMNTRSALLAQNWDWSEALEKLVVLVRLQRPDNHSICMLTEPGIIGKIGMNRAGLGVCLNILKTSERLHGLPVHILLRAILDCGDITEVRQLLGMVGVGKASHILVGDANGECVSVEFAGSQVLALQPRDGVLLHSNHYLAAAELNDLEAFPSTHERLQQATELMDEDASVSGIHRMLRDQTRGEMSICRPYSESAMPGYGKVGTVFTLLMDLGQRTMTIQRGPYLDAATSEVYLG